jgi:PAS domain S-box-containing protein
MTGSGRSRPGGEEKLDEGAAPSDDGRYARLLNSIYDTVLIVDAKGRILDANKRSEDCLLFDLQTLCSLNVAEVIPKAGTGWFEIAMVRLLDGKYVVLDDAECVRMDGSRFRVDVTVSEISREPERELCFFLHDLTVRKQAEEALRGALRGLEKHDRARSLFVSNVTHELRTPVVSITYGISNLLRSEESFSPHTIDSLKRLDREGKRLLHTVNDILDFDRLETGSMNLTKIPVPLLRMVAECVDCLSLEAEHKGVELRVKPGLFPGFVYCDRKKMERAFLNIIGNGVKYTPSGGRVGVVVGPCESDSNAYVVKVDDTGVGIPEHALGKVMDRYYRVGEHADGAGLGLSIAGEMIELHGGTVQIQSPPEGRDKGTCVSVTLPATRAPSVLIVDDDPEVRSILEKVVSSWGYQVSVAEDGETAWLQMRDCRPDLAIIDVMLPGIDGIELIVKTLGDTSLRGMATVAITGGSIEGGRREVLSSFSIQLISKPVTEDSLLGAMEAALLGTTALVNQEKESYDAQTSES